MIIVSLHWDRWCCWQSPLQTSIICLYQPLESLIWAAPSRFLYLLCFFHLFVFLFLYFNLFSYVVKLENHILQLWRFGERPIYLPPLDISITHNYDEGSFWRVHVMFVRCSMNERITLKCGTVDWYKSGDNSK